MFIQVDVFNNDIQQWYTVGTVIVVSNANTILLYPG